MPNKLFNAHIASSQVLLTPQELKSKLPLTDSTKQTVLKFREEVENILTFQDNRKFIVVGPCSIHDTKAAEEYAKKLKKLSEHVKEKLLLVMRVYLRNLEQL